jgi:hypothetical protein
MGKLRKYLPETSFEIYHMFYIVTNFLIVTFIETLSPTFLGGWYQKRCFIYA